MTRELFEIKDLEEITPWKRAKLEEFRDSGVLEMQQIGRKWVCTRNQLNNFIQKVEVDPEFINAQMNEIF